MSTASTSTSTSTTSSYDNKYVGRRFVGKVAIVTGSSEGIGYGIAYRLAQEGAHVVINARRKELVDEAVKTIKKAGFAASGLAVDVTKASDRKALIDHALQLNLNGKIDTLVNNVGTYVNTNLLDATSEEWDGLFNLNVKSGWELTKEAHSHIPKGGSVLFISSAGGYIPGPPFSLYGITKTLMFGLSAALSKELAPKGIRVNTLSPGPIRTPLITKTEETEEGKAWIGSLSAGVSLKRLGTQEEIGGAAAFLCSDDAGYITGESITAQGGSIGARL